MLICYLIPVVVNVLDHKDVRMGVVDVGVPRIQTTHAGSNSRPQFENSFISNPECKIRTGPTPQHHTPTPPHPQYLPPPLSIPVRSNLYVASWDAIVAAIGIGVRQ